ncbi:MAG: septum formation inhibitor Maf [Nitriliruptorales bacterium]|nr:septum formation inhibitor Maf [Nitriliruptorales bacterium]
MAEPALVLASASPRRLALLRLAGLEPEVGIPQVDERLRDDEEPAGYVQRLAREKACAIAAPGAVVVGADTAVVVDGAVLGKPADAADAAAMLRRLSGRTHTVSTGVAVRAADGRVTSTAVTTEVEMVALSEVAVQRYVATGEPLDKAGAYGIQGRAAAFVRRIEGSWTNVVGLPLAETLELLGAAGVGVTPSASTAGPGSRQ